MNVEEFRDYCLSFPGVTEGFPFGGDVLVFKVMGKMFALSDIEKFEGINLKCDPERSMILREEYEEIQPGYHMNKKLWNTVSTHGRVDDKLMKELITHSYELIVDSLPNKLKNQLKDPE